MYRLVGISVSASSDAGAPPVLSPLHVGGRAVVAFILFSNCSTHSLTLLFRAAPHFVVGVVVVVAEVVARVWSSVPSLWSLWLLWSSFACACSCGCSGVVVAVAVMLLAMSVEALVPPVRGGVSPVMPPSSVMLSSSSLSVSVHPPHLLFQIFQSSGVVASCSLS